MMLGIYMQLCEMCRRLITVCQAQQSELVKLKANPAATKTWEKEIEHIRNMLRKIED